jgi:hypothetical protein
MRTKYESKISKEIIKKWDDQNQRRKIFIGLLENLKRKKTEIEALTDSVELSGDTKAIREHHLACEATRTLISILEDRLRMVMKLSCEAYDRYNFALENSNPCFLCKYFHKDRDGSESCVFGDIEKPLSKVSKCPDPRSQSGHRLPGA